MTSGGISQAIGQPRRRVQEPLLLYQRIKEDIDRDPTSLSDDELFTTFEAIHGCLDEIRVHIEWLETYHKQWMELVEQYPDEAREMENDRLGNYSSEIKKGREAEDHLLRRIQLLRNAVAERLNIKNFTGAHIPSWKLRDIVRFMREDTAYTETPSLECMYICILTCPISKLQWNLRDQVSTHHAWKQSQWDVEPISIRLFRSKFRRPQRRLARRLPKLSIQDSTENINYPTADNSGRRNSEIEDLMTELRTICDRLSTYQGSISESTKVLSEVSRLRDEEQRIQRYRNTYRNVKQQLDEEKKQNGLLKGQITTVEEQKVLLEAELQRAEERETGLQKQIEELKRDLQDMSKRFLPYCGYCRMRKHAAVNCPLYSTTTQKERRIQFLNICRRCLGNHDFHRCLSRTECRICHSTQHHTSICDHQGVPHKRHRGHSPTQNFPNLTP